MKIRNYELFVALEDDSEKMIICDCGGKNFVAKGNKIICLYCNNKRN